MNNNRNNLELNLQPKAPEVEEDDFEDDEFFNDERVKKPKGKKIRKMKLSYDR